MTSPAKVSNSTPTSASTTTLHRRRTSSSDDIHNVYHPTVTFEDDSRYLPPTHASRRPNVVKSPSSPNQSMKQWSDSELDNLVDLLFPRILSRIEQQLSFVHSENSSSNTTENRDHRTSIHSSVVSCLSEVLKSLNETSSKNGPETSKKSSHASNRRNLDPEIPDMSVISDVNLKSGSLAEPNVQLIKVWKVKNTGQITWPDRLRVIPIHSHVTAMDAGKKNDSTSKSSANDTSSETSSTAVTIRPSMDLSQVQDIGNASFSLETDQLLFTDLKPGDSMNISVAFRTPAAGGHYVHHYTLAYSDEDKTKTLAFGAPLILDLNIKSNSESSDSSTASKPRISPSGKLNRTRPDSPTKSGYSSKTMPAHAFETLKNKNSLNDLSRSSDEAVQNHDFLNLASHMANSDSNHSRSQHQSISHSNVSDFFDTLHKDIDQNKQSIVFDNISGHSESAGNSPVNSNSNSNKMEWLNSAKPKSKPSEILDSSSHSSSSSASSHPRPIAGRPILPPTSSQFTVIPRSSPTSIPPPHSSFKSMGGTSPSTPPVVSLRRSTSSSLTGADASVKSNSFLSKDDVLAWAGPTVSSTPPSPILTTNAISPTMRPNDTAVHENGPVVSMHTPRSASITVSNTNRRGSQTFSNQ